MTATMAQRINENALKRGCNGSTKAVIAGIHSQTLLHCFRIKCVDIIALIYWPSYPVISEVLEIGQFPPNSPIHSYSER